MKRGWIDKLGVAGLLVRSLVGERSKRYSHALDLHDRVFRKVKPNYYWMARRASLLLLNGQTADAISLIRKLGEAPVSAEPKREYVRIASKMWATHFDGDPVTADRLFAELKSIDCPATTLRSWLPSESRPSIQLAESMLVRMGLGNADPLGFYEEETGVHLLLSFEAYAESKLEKALDHLEVAERIRPLTLEQLTLKAALLAHLDEGDRAEAIFAEVANAIPASDDNERAYLRDYCLLYRRSDRVTADQVLETRLIDLGEKVSISKIFPISDASAEESEIDLESVRNHFAAIGGAYRLRFSNLPRLTR